MILKAEQSEELFTIFHFNDTYDIQSNKKGLGGIVNFESYLRKLRVLHKKHIVLFSGDCLSPSVLTNIFRGQQMIKAMNKLNIDIATYGNHQFEFQPQRTLQLVEKFNFPWLLGNIKYKSTHINLGNGTPYIIKQMFGCKIGVFGLAGEDWLGILRDHYENKLQYIDVNEHSREMCRLLKEKQNCDFVVALTHMRVPQDEKLPLEAPGIDIVLGGHDHIILNKFINQVPVLKSGDNFKTISIIKVFKKNDNKEQLQGKNYNFQITTHSVPKAEISEIDDQLQSYVQQCMNEYNKNDNLVGFSAIDLDTRFSEVRTKQTNYGNFLADIARAYYGSDCCILNSGSIRNDVIIKAGELYFSMVSNLINDVLIVKSVPGSAIFAMLQYSCSNLPDIFAGSFSLVSGIKYWYDYRLSPRIQKVQINGQPLILEKEYKLTTFFYLSSGGDGFTQVKNYPFIIDEVAGIDLLSLLLKFFRQCSSSAGKESHSRSEKLINQFQKEKGNKGQSNDEKKSSRMDRLSQLIHRVIQKENGRFIEIKPEVDGRIVSLYP